MMTECPECGFKELDRVEVDIGVGVLCGPPSCPNCGWRGDDVDFGDPELTEDGE